MWCSLRYMCMDYECLLSRRRRWKFEVLLGLAILSLATLLLSRQLHDGSKVQKHATLRVSRRQRRINEVLVSYSYYEKDEGQKGNLEYFILEGLGINGMRTRLPAATDFVIVVNGDKCSPCTALRSSVTTLNISLEGVRAAWGSQHITVLHRVENSGMDIAAHNVTLSYLQQTNELHVFKYFIFLNSSVRGPFFPRWITSSIPTWQWTDAFVSRLTGEVKLVASSIACLPPIDSGGYGPKAESWAFAVDSQSLRLLMDAGVFWMRMCKLCTGDEGIVVASEYAMSKVVLDAGFNLATLMARYAEDTDWRDMANWNCNDNVHPSRHGTYDGISMHPYETLFVKESWRVGEPFLSRYTRWRYEHGSGRPGTGGSFNKCLYKHALSEKGRDPQRTKDLFLPQDTFCPESDQ